jgi:hypothetical protein
MSAQTTIQILRCLTLGRYTATVEDGELKIRGPQPLAGPLPASIRARREELITCLNNYCGGVWPPAPGSRGWAKRQPRKKPREERTREFLVRLRKRREEAA